MEDNQEAKKEIVAAVRGLTALTIDFLYLNELGGVPLTTGLNSIADLMSAFAKRKLGAYRKQLTDITPEQFLSFQSKEFKTQEELTAFWEKEMLDLARFDDDQKAIIKGRLLKAVIEQNVNVSEYRRMCLALDQMLAVDFDALYESFVIEDKERGRLISSSPGHSKNKLAIEQCAQLGLIERDKIIPLEIQERTTIPFDKLDAINELYKELKWRLTKIGEKLIKFGLMP